MLLTKKCTSYRHYSPFKTKQEIILKCNVSHSYNYFSRVNTAEIMLSILNWKIFHCCFFFTLCFKEFTVESVFPFFFSCSCWKNKARWLNWSRIGSNLVNFHYIPIKIIIKIYTFDLTFTSPNIIRRILVSCFSCSKSVNHFMQIYIFMK